MRRRRSLLLLSSLILLAASAVPHPDRADAAQLPVIEVSASPNGIVPLPATAPAVFRDVFVKYTKVIAPNGKPIHLLAQSDWTDDKLLKARSVLEHMLTDVPGSAYGSRKADVANAMAAANAVLILFNDSQAARKAMRGPLGEVSDLKMQSMWANEITVEGSDDYMNHVTRDATFEEVWHLVHEAGVMAALPEFQAEIEAAKQAAVKAGWGRPNNDPSTWHSEYFAQQYDNYLDLWAIPPKVWEGRKIKPGEIPEGTAHWGQNRVNSRRELEEMDPVGYRLVEKFFPPYLTYAARLPEGFEGTFSLKYDASLAYTWKSRHLKDVSLRGVKNADILGNAYDNVLTGNSGDNTLTGGPGNDCLIGCDGVDTAAFSGNAEDYVVSRTGAHVVVKDRRVGRDGEDILVGVEILRFADRSDTLGGRSGPSGPLTGWHRDRPSRD